MERATEFQQHGGDWRALGSGVSAWFDAPSHAAGAALAGRVAELAGAADVDLRAGGVRVRLGTSELTPAEVSSAGTISAAARDLGLTANPAALQTLRFQLASTDPASLIPFWQRTLAFRPAGADRLEDPLRRDPAVSFPRLDQPRPLRNRIHVDVSRISEAVTAARSAIGQVPYGAYQVALADADGNELDLVPGDPLGDGPETADWRVVFGAMAFYPCPSPPRSSELVAAVAGLADDAGIPLLIDRRPEGVLIDSAKDRWEIEPGFMALAGRVQAAARELGFVADPAPLRFMQFGLDAVDVPTVRSFWATVLGYQPDERPFLSDLCDPRRLDPVLFFQDLDPAEDERRRQRNRLRFELTVPYDQLQARLEAALGAGGRILADVPGGHTVADPEGNEVDLISRTNVP